MHEARMHDESSFVTLTYDDDHLPSDFSLNHSHFVKFFKRLRERLKPRKIRFYMGGEYGEENSRPHYHAAIFGYFPEDIKFWKTGDSGFKIYTSEFLKDVWSMGAVYVGHLTFESASYIARYCLKKERGVKNREILDVTTGEIIYRVNEYGRMSLKPGIGSEYLKKYGRDVFMNDRVVMRGFESAVPRYYDKELEKLCPLLLAENKAKRRAKADARMAKLYQERPDLYWSDPRRLDVEETVKKASLKLLKRS